MRSGRCCIQVAGLALARTAQYAILTSNCALEACTPSKSLTLSLLVQYLLSVQGAACSRTSCLVRGSFRLPAALSRPVMCHVPFLCPQSVLGAGCGEHAKTAGLCQSWQKLRGHNDPAGQMRLNAFVYCNGYRGTPLVRYGIVWLCYSRGAPCKCLFLRVPYR